MMSDDVNDDDPSDDNEEMKLDSLVDHYLAKFFNQCHPGSHI